MRPCLALIVLLLAGCSNNNAEVAAMCGDDLSKVYIGESGVRMELCYLQRPIGQSLIRTTQIGSVRQEIYQDVRRSGAAFVYVENGQVVGWTGRGP